MTNNKIDEVITKLLSPLECDQWKPFNSYSMMKGNCGHEKCRAKNMIFNYSSSRHACQDIFTSFTEEIEMNKFISFLTSIVENELENKNIFPEYDTTIVFYLINASPMNICEAFLRYKKLWED